ncbi:hypothetical protein [Streptomyces sp. NPDC057909]|uniref:hypothetical protein n=1 Tax=Streptomyces sp. NPDC057909 TaxID=3346277 RepID=UPI0036ED1779
MRPMRPSGENGIGDDDALLRAVAHADAAALAALYDRHAGWLLARLSRRCAHVRGRRGPSLPQTVSDGCFLVSIALAGFVVGRLSSWRLTAPVPAFCTCVGAAYLAGAALLVVRGAQPEPR